MCGDVRVYETQKPDLIEPGRFLMRPKDSTEEEAHECPHCQIVEMKTGEAVLFRGAPEDGNLHGVAGVKDEPPPEDLRARCEAVARRFPKPGAVVAETRAPTVLGCVEINQ